MKHKTMLVVEITHDKPLPTRLDVTDALTQRTYNWLFANGVEAGVKVVLAGAVLSEGALDADSRN